MEGLVGSWKELIVDLKLVRNSMNLKKFFKVLIGGIPHFSSVYIINVDFLGRECTTINLYMCGCRCLADSIWTCVIHYFVGAWSEKKEFLRSSQKLLPRLE